MQQTNSNQHLHTQTDAHIQTDANTHTHTHTHTCTHTHTHAHAHTHVHAHTPAAICKMMPYQKHYTAVGQLFLTLKHTNAFFLAEYHVNTDRSSLSAPWFF